MNLVFNLRKLLKHYKKNLFIVVFLGPDGSGKSSLINKLISEYKCFGFNYHSHIYPKLNTHNTYSNGLGFCNIFVT